jgi:Protein of unknown function (DUF664)
LAADSQRQRSLNQHGSGGGPVSLREVQVGMIEEYTRHMGHVDLRRERIDGRIGQITGRAATAKPPLRVPAWLGRPLPAAAVARRAYRSGCLPVMPHSSWSIGSGSVAARSTHVMPSRNTGNSGRSAPGRSTGMTGQRRLTNCRRNAASS